MVYDQDDVLYPAVPVGQEEGVLEYERYIEDNTADVAGGAVYLNGTGNILSNVIFKGNKALDGGALYLASGNSVSLDTASFEDNSHTDGDLNTRGTIFLGDDAVFGAVGLDLPEGQDIYNGTYYATVIYVSVDGGERNLGLTSSTPIRLDQVWDHFKPELINTVIFTDSGDYTLFKTLTGYNNLTIIGNNAKIKTQNKYLFIEPKMILF